MRRILLILCSLLASVMLAHGGNTKEVRLHFDASDFTLTQENGAYSISSSKFPTVFDTDTLSPALPYFLVNVLVSPSQEFQSLSVSGQETLLYGGIDLTPNKLPVPTNALNTYAPNQTVSYTKPSYPQESVRYLSMHTLGSYKYVSLMVCPLRYDAGTRSLHLISDMRILLSMSHNSTVALFATDIQSISHQEKMREEIKRMVFNQEDVDELYPVVTEKVMANYFPTRYLIITNDSLKPAFQKLANWKTTKGIKSKVLTVEEINRQYNDSIVPMRIKRAIMQYKGKVDYVLLGGDTEVVPSLHCMLDFKRVFGKSFKTPTKDTPGDMYYACLSDLDWDKNKNGFFGEKEDSISVLSDLAVSRLSVSNLEEAEMIVDKLVNYEMSPNLQQFSDSILMCANTISIINSAQDKSDDLYNSCIKPYWNGTRMRLYDNYTDFEGGADYDFTPLHLQEQLSRGYLLVDVIAHGWNNLWGYLEYRTPKPVDSDNYKKDLAEQLVNPKYTTITSISCNVNQFDMANDTLCLSESFMRNINSNVLAFVGNSREGIFPNEENLMYYLYKGVFAYHMSFAEALSYAKNTYSATFSKPEWRWLLLGLNALGDPEAHLYLSKPKRFNDVQIQYANHQVLIKLNEDSCSVCLSKIDNDGKLQFYRIQTPKTPTYTFEEIPDEFTLCITKQGFVPYCVNVVKSDSGEIYLQNIVINDNSVVTGNHIYVGKDVNRGTPQGPVQIQTGETLLQASQSVILKNAFQVAKGASLKIKTN